MRAGKTGTGDGVTLIAEHTTETTTTALIHNWSMSGARRRGLGAHFGSPVDIHAAVAERNEELPEPAAGHVLMKPAGEDDWRPLLVGVPQPD